MKMLFKLRMARFAARLGVLGQAIVLLWCLMQTTQLWAHQASTSYLNIAQVGQANTYNVDYALSLRDLMLLLDVDQNRDLQLTWGEVEQQSSAIEQLFEHHLALSANGQPCMMTPSEPLMLDQHAGEIYVLQHYHVQCDRALSQLNYQMLSDIDDAHRVLMTLKLASPTQDSASNAQHNIVQSYPLAAGVHELSAQQNQHAMWRYVYEGIHHLLIGWDHLLFLFSLVVAAVYRPKPASKPIQLEAVALPWQALKRTFWIATCFTLAHSITLCLAALHIVNLPTRFIESAIAATIVLVALNNLRPTLWRGILPLTFVFGLIHGFGFANVIVDLPIDAWHKAIALLLFNVGIEIAQILCISIALPLALYIRHSQIYKQFIFRGGSLVAVLFGLYWFIQRAFAL